MKDVKLFHQCGFRYKWNMEVFSEDHIGDGFIFSPLDMSKKIISELDDGIIKNSFFDSQFYLLNIYKDNYLSFKILEEVDSIYDFMIEKNKIAQKCVEYQNNIVLKYIVIPTIDLNLLSLDENYGELYDQIKSENDDPSIVNINNKFKLLNKLIVQPFVNEIKEQKVNKEVLLTVIFDDEMAKNDTLFDSYLSQITDNENIDGIYLIPSNDRTYKRVSDINYLVRIMTFIYTLRKNDMEVIVGYSDIETILYTAAGATGVSLGIYENLRNYDGRKFKNEKYNGRGPNPRVFSSKLFQWIEYVYLEVIKENKNLDEIFDKNNYFIETQNNDYKWHFSRPQCYKHFMSSYGNLIKSLPNSFEDRYNYIEDKLRIANETFNELGQCIFFDENSSGSHINKWRTALKSFYKKVKEN